MQAMPSVTGFDGGAMSALAALADLPVSGGARRKPYRVAELAVRWDVHKSTIYRMIYAGVLRAERHGPRRGAVRVPVDAVAEYEQATAAALTPLHAQHTGTGEVA